MIGMSGRYKLAAVNAETGEVREETPWFDNLITDAGLDRIAKGGFMDVCMVGTGSATPTTADTVLGNQRASTTTELDRVSTSAAAAPWYVGHRRTYRFPVGAAAGNLTEVGVGWHSTLVFSRTLIKDGGGNPTSLTVLPSEYLDVTYEFRVYSAGADTPIAVSIAGAAYTGTIRSAYAASPSSYDIRQIVSGGVGSPTGRSSTIGTTGTLGPVTGGLSVDTGYVLISPSCFTSATYVPGSKKVVVTLTLGLNDANLAGGIGLLQTGSIPTAFQMSFSPPIPKTSAQTLSLKFELSWDRRSV